MTNRDAKPSYEKYRDKTASDIPFDEFMSQLTFDGVYDVLSVKATHISGGSENPLSFSVHTAAWWDGDETWSNGWIYPDIYITATISLLVNNSGGRAEVKYELGYMSFIPMDQKAFIRFSEDRLVKDLWPDFKERVAKLFDLIDLGSIALPENIQTERDESRTE